MPKRELPIDERRSIDEMSEIEATPMIENAPKVERTTGMELSCPRPLRGYDRVVLAHGGGGLLMHRLIDGVFKRAFDNRWLGAGHDGAVIPTGAGHLAMSTDSYVVRPMFFPGGDIGKLAVFGTVNDLAMCGARPLYLSAGFILEEGTETDALERVVKSMAEAARATGVSIVTGDTKVVERGKGDQIFINTTGIGLVEATLSIGPTSVREGDAILLSGDIGRHGIAVMAARDGLAFETDIESDCAPLSVVVQALLAEGIELRCLRDCTRGGVASALVEIATMARLDVQIDEAAIPVDERVRGACEVFGLDPLYVANEGCMVVFLPGHSADRALEIMREHAVSHRACQVGFVGGPGRGEVTLRSILGTNRVVDMLSGEQLPRIC